MSRATGSARQVGKITMEMKTALLSPKEARWHLPDRDTGLTARPASHPAKPPATRRTQPLSPQGRGSSPRSGVGSPETPTPSQPVLCQLPAGQRRFSSAIRRGRGQRRLSLGIAPDPAMPRRAALGARSPPGPRAPQLPRAPLPGPAPPPLCCPSGRGGGARGGSAGPIRPRTAGTARG